MCYFCSNFAMTFFSLIIPSHINKQNNKNTPLDSANLNIGGFQSYFVFSSTSERAWRGFFHWISYLRHMENVIYLLRLFCDWGEGLLAHCSINISFAKVNVNMLVHQQKHKGMCPNFKEKRIYKMMLHIYIMLSYKWNLEIKEIT